VQRGGLRTRQAWNATRGAGNGLVVVIGLPFLLLFFWVADPAADLARLLRPREACLPLYANGDSGTLEEEPLLCQHLARAPVLERRLRRDRETVEEGPGLGP
jgi:hypothetical protein